LKDNHVWNFKQDNYIHNLPSQEVFPKLNELPGTYIETNRAVKIFLVFFSYHHYYI
jgi:hypothetical protein